ncbi:transglutaminase family protein [Halorhodospira sp. 9621]|uniref:transglutaminase-like domain-containing protein n=1 Tax=Halorhodospira sp. 9621 TaxID=2899135 RepID=UPI001EE7AD7D|nr:transglutaminase family protein [Halorhodospira sp. 9621]MCG5532320.1 transglutaminase family protein [Halorhodospira sp. 9621]
MWLRVSCHLELELEGESLMLFMLRARSSGRQWVARDRYAVRPSLPITEYRDLYGNACQRLLASAGALTVSVSADVRVPAGVEQQPGAPFVPVQDLPQETLIHLLPSRYCESDRLLAQASDIVAGQSPGYDQVAAIATWIYHNVAYQPTTDPEPISAQQLLERRAGVCRDFAHLGIALCRSLSIPARLVTGYLQGLEPMDLHAWFEAYVGGGWFTFDPTRETLEGARVQLGHGRDAADAPVFHQFGPPVVPSVMQVQVEPISGPDAGLFAAGVERSARDVG